MSDLSQVKVNGTLYQFKDSSARTTLDNKADKATTLAGYGITDAYTQSQADTKFLPLEGGTVTGNIIPNATGTINLGASNLKFGSIYADEVHISQNTLYVGETPVLGTDSDTIIVKADKDHSLLVKTTGQGATQVSSESSIQLNSTGQASKININASGSNSDVSITASNAVSIQGSSVSIKGNTTIENLNVTGTTTTVNSTDLNIKDNIITLNKGQTGEGVSAGKAGIQIDRGDAAKYQILFDESDDLFKVGMVGTTLGVIATRDYADNAVKDKANKATTLSGYGITDAYTKEETTGITNNKVDVSAYNTKMTALDTSISGLETNKQAVIADLETIRTNASTGASLKEKVDGIDSGAQVNVIETVKIGDSALSVTDKTVTIDLSGKSDVGHKHNDIYYTQQEVDLKITAKANSATTLEGYGILDAKIANGVITLGGNSITPITSHQSISGKADKENITGGNFGPSSEVTSNEVVIPYVTVNTQGIISAITSNKFTVPVMTGASSADNGKIGLVPAPSKNDNGKYLRADGSWSAPTDTVTTSSTTGDGNAVTSITATNGVLAVVKGTTFLTSHQDISGKADKASTLAGYGIADAYTKIEVDTAIEAGGKVKKVNGIEPDENGNITVTIPTATDTYSSTTSDAMSGKAVASAISSKADKATTLAGYGITDAFTKTETSCQIADEIAKVVANAPEDFDTLKEIADWINNDTTGAASMASDISDLKSGKADSNHTHDLVYAKISHGNHVPRTETADNAKFLRNDNTWANVTPENIGAATSNHNHDSVYSKTDANVTCTLETETKAYLCGTTSNTTSTCGLVFDTGVYLDATTGKITATTFNGTATAAYYNDYAEWFPRGGETEVGDIIALDISADHECYIKATPKCHCIVGVHSETYGHIVGGEKTPDGEDFREYQKKNYIPVGLAGRVPVKFVGEAKRGMAVVPSDIDGVGRCMQDGDNPLSVIGMLIEEDKKLDVRLLKVLIK